MNFLPEQSLLSLIAGICALSGKHEPLQTLRESAAPYASAGREAEAEAEAGMPYAFGERSPFRRRAVLVLV